MFNESGYSDSHSYSNRIKYSYGNHLILDGPTRHLVTIRLFMMWLELQKADGFRPKVNLDLDD